MASSSVGAESFHGPYDGRQLARQPRPPEVHLEEAHRFRAIRAERRARNETERGVVFVDRRDQRILAHAWREISSIQSNSSRARGGSVNAISCAALACSVRRVRPVSYASRCALCRLSGCSTAVVDVR